MTIDVAGVDEGRLCGVVDHGIRGLEATAPDTCPLKVLLTRLYAVTTQSCGKCVPCYHGVPLMVVLLQKMIDLDASSDDLEQLKAYAKMASELSDCAVGYEAGSIALEMLEAFSDEFELHACSGECSHAGFRMVPCETLCPAHVNVPAYIALVGGGDYAGAINMIRRDNPFPTACALVCEHPCERRCRRTVVDAPLNIRGIKKFAVDQRHADTVEAPKRLPDTGKRVAVVGAGPSGLTCAYFLALMGHSVTVFEGRKRLGGMLRYGIPAYRFPRERLDEDIRAILSVGGIEVRTEVQVDELMMRDIRSSYDAVYVAIGAQVGKRLKIDGAESEGVYSAVDVLGRIGDDDYPDFTGLSVAVIGGGNVAMDCARTAIRARAKEVSVIYRRRREDMTALEAEIDAAVCEGVELRCLQAPVAIEADDAGHARHVLVQPQYIGPVKAGRPAPVTADKPALRVPADIVLIAVGQDVVSSPFESFGMKAQGNVFGADAYLAAQTEVGADVLGVFVGGDCQTGPATAIRAIGAGKTAAYNIDDYLGFDHELDCGVVVPDPNANNRVPTGRVEVMERPASLRKLDFGYVEEDVSFEEAVQECGRCLRCDCYGFLSPEQRGTLADLQEGIPDVI